MTQVDAYNAALIQMCEENGYKFLNSAEVLRDGATGWAKTDYTLSDGVHLSKTAVTEYFTYVRTHAYVTEDRRPQPLGNIPTPVGPPVNLISQDPIAVRGAKVPLEFVATNGGKISGSASQLVKKGATASAVTAVPDDGFVFAGWTSSTGASYSSETLSFTMPSDANAGGVVLTAHFTADEHEHNYVEIEGTKVAATCLTDGTCQYKCTICGEIIEETTYALGHDWDEGTTYSDAIVYTCKRCGEQKKEQIVHMHNYQLVSETMATCISDGLRTYRCSCGDEYTESVPATGHNWKETERHAPTYEQDGWIHYECTNAGCGEWYDEVLPKLQPTPTPPPDSDSSSSTVNPGDSSGEASSTSYTEESETFE